MKVLMTADAVGGVWTYALDLSAALAEHGVAVVLATMGPRPSDEQRAAARSLGNVRLVESDYRLEWMEEPWTDVAAAGEWLLSLADANATDLVHLNGYTHAALPWQRPVVCVAHSCVTSWWRAVHGTRPPEQWDIYRRNVARGLNCADHVVAPTHAFLDELRSCYEFNPPARVIYNARANTARCADNRAGEHRQPLVLACGRPWDVSKNMRALDDAAHGLDWPAYVIGCQHGPDGRSFAPTSLHCLGTLPSTQVAAWLRRTSIFVHPALYEPFGLAVLEAAMTGCALVLADIPSLRELWNGAAEFFDPRDSRNLHTRLKHLIDDPRRRNLLLAAARERATHYRIDGMASDYFDLYQTLARCRAGRERAVA